MHTKTKLEILRQLNKRHAKASGIAKGFTLVELMIVVAVVGILSAVALPQYLQARNSAIAGAGIGEALGLAKECATFVASGVGGAPEATVTSASVKVTTACSTTGGVLTVTWPAGPVGIRCLDKESIATNNNAVITVSDKGSISCALS